ncbi:outer membrane beta-barrel family protein [Pontibacter rugosus]
MSFAQQEGTLSGTVAEENGQAVGFANVAVLEATTEKIVTGAIADMDGRFQIKTPAKGKYKLKLTNLGYQEIQTSVFEVSSTAFNKDFGKLQMKADVKTLKEVQVQAMRPTITTTPDKMVVSVDGTAMAAGNTAYEVLAKSPGIWIDQEGNIQLNGKAGVQVMLNGKRSYLSGKELQNLLQSMAAENIKDLEIITNPSARYDAEGASGIININLKKNQLTGMSGSVYGGYQYNKLNTYTSGAELSYKSGKWNSYGSVDLSRRMRYRDMDMYRRYANEEGGKSVLNQEGYEESERLQPSLRVGTDYDLNELHSIGATANLIFNNNSTSFHTRSLVLNEVTNNRQAIDALNTSDGSYGNGTFNLHYLGKLDTTGTTLSADLDYVRINSNDDFKFRNLYSNPTNSAPDRLELLLSENPTNYEIFSGKVDFTMPLAKNTKMEVGAKASHVVSDNELEFYQTLDNRKILDKSRSNHFIYTENIYAAYVNVSSSLGKNWTFQGGLRAEQTESKGESITLNKPNNRSYLDFFPSVFVQQKVSDNYQIGYKYSRRINRPDYEALNPFIFYLDPITVAQGNPILKPQYTNSFEVTHTLNQTYNLILGYALTKDYIAEIPYQKPGDSISVFQQQNVRDLKSANATLVAPVKFSKKWEANNNLILMYQEFTTLVDDNLQVNDQVTFIGQSNHNLLLPYGMRLELGANYQGPAVYGLYQVDDQWWVDAGLKRSFMDDKLTLTLNVSDIFKSRVLIVDSQVNGNINKIEQYQGAQGIRFNLRYRFSKGTKFESKKRNINLDELNRAGGN